MTNPSAADPLIGPTDTGRGRANAFLTIGHILNAVGADHDPPIGLNDIRLIRHSFNANDDAGLHGPEDLTDDRVLAYTRRQDASTRRFPGAPERYWIVLIADGQRRSRLFGVYENHGELSSDSDADHRSWDLHRSDFLASLAGRLVIDWTSPRNWHRRATAAAGLPVLEIADRDKVPFPGFDRVLLPWHELKEMTTDRRYEEWRTALSEVQGIYLITDSSTGRQYVGKADGGERLLGRWAAYARDGHGGNVALRQLAAGDDAPHPDVDEHARHFVFSILRVFGPSTSSSEVDAAESHYKKALMTREFGLNLN